MRWFAFGLYILHFAQSANPELNVFSVNDHVSFHTQSSDYEEPLRRQSQAYSSSYPQGKAYNSAYSGGYSPPSTSKPTSKPTKKPTPPTHSAYGYQTPPPTPAAKQPYRPSPTNPPTNPPSEKYSPPTNPPSQKYSTPTNPPSQNYSPPTNAPSQTSPPTNAPSQSYSPPTNRPSTNGPTNAPSQNYAPPTNPPSQQYTTPTPPPSQQYTNPPSQYTAPSQQYTTPTNPPSSKYPASPRAYEAAYPLPSLPTPQPTIYIAPRTPATPPKKAKKGKKFQYVPSYPSYPSYPVPPVYVRPTPAPYVVRGNPGLMCPGSVMGCFQGHLRHCQSNTMRQDDAPIVRRCDQGCKACPNGVPDACNNDRYGKDICQSMAIAHRRDRTCTTEQNLQVGCLGGPDIGYCFQGTTYIVDYCGAAGCLGNPVPDQCNPTVFTPPPSAVRTLAPVSNPNDLCPITALLCYKGHLRLCVAGMPKDMATVLHDCRSQGCSTCPSGPDLCNDATGQNMCAQAPPAAQFATCANQQQTVGSYCDGTNVRHCDPSNRGILVEYCGTSGCQMSPPQCFKPVNKTNLCQGTFVQCHLGDIRLCVDQQSPDDGPILHECRNQGCSNCPDAPAICNDEQGRSLCGQVPPDRFAIPCDTNQQRMTFCDGPDVRHCDPSNRAFLVEFCDARGCRDNPISCNPTLPSPTPASGGQSPTPAVPAQAPTPGSSVECGPRVRREWGSLPDVDRRKYIQALLQLYARGEMERFAQFHYDNRDQVHGSGMIQFFIWHRVLLFEVEESIRAMPGFECVTIPYWNYEYSNTASKRTDRRSAFGTSDTKLGQGDRSDCIGGAFSSFRHHLEGSNTCIRRDPNAGMVASLANSVFVDLCQIGVSDFNMFSENLQNTHGSPHISFGGTFSTHFSPVDPLFFVHHANIDRIWDMWQDCHTDYQWYEPGGLGAPVAAYNGINAGNFIDNTQIRWLGKPYAVSYSSDQFEDPSVYSSDFRRNVATRCVQGRFRRYDSPSPILGVDDIWALTQNLREFTFNMTKTVRLVEEEVALPCTSATGKSTIDTLQPQSSPVAVYDNLNLQDCVSKCSVFYWKATGDSNCVCLTEAVRSQRSVARLGGDLSATVIRYLPTCTGPDTDYALFQNVQRPTRRLLQQRLVSTSQPPTPDNAGPPTDGQQDNQTDNGQDNAQVPQLTTDLRQANNQLCFDSLSSQKTSAQIACSSADVRPIPLPKAWLEMNHLNPDSADLCSRYQQAVGSQTIDCLNQ